MITEEYVKSYPHVFKNGIYLFAVRGCEPDESRLPKVADCGSYPCPCPYCGRSDGGTSSRIDGGWSWVTYECGVELSYRYATISGRLILGITPQTAECRFSVFNTTEIATEDTI